MPDDLKTRINVELLRGILLAYVGYECYRWVDAFLSVNAKRYHLPVMVTSTQWAGVTTGLLFGSVIYSLLLYGLLFHASRSAQVVFVLLTFLALISIASAVYSLTAYAPSQSSRSPSRRIVSALISIGMAGVACAHFRGWQRPKRSNQTMQLTAGRRESSAQSL